MNNLIRLKLNLDVVNNCLEKSELNLTQLVNILLIEFNTNPNLRKKFQKKYINKNEPSKDGGWVKNTKS